MMNDFQFFRKCLDILAEIICLQVEDQLGKKVIKSNLKFIYDIWSGCLWTIWIIWHHFVLFSRKWEGESLEKHGNILISSASIIYQMLNDISKRTFEKCGSLHSSWIRGIETHESLYFESILHDRLIESSRWTFQSVSSYKLDIWSKFFMYNTIIHIWDIL
jgi:hypothetical protein